MRLLGLLAAYLIGEIPVGYVVARLRGGGDIRRAGSGSIGATNVLRTLGKGPAIATLLGDILKGFAAVSVARAADASPAWAAAGAVLRSLQERLVLKHCHSSLPDRLVTDLRKLECYLLTAR